MKPLFFIDLVRRGDPLAYGIYEFNCQIARYIHPSYRKKVIPEPVFRLLIESKAGEKLVSRHLMKIFQIDPDMFFDFESPDLRLALRPGKAIEKTIFLAGLGWNARGIRRIIEKNEVNRITQSIGAQAYRFAICQAPFLFGEVGPESGDSLPKNWERHCIKCGTRLLYRSFQNESEAFLIRLKLKLPQWFASFFCPETTPGDPKIAREIFRKLGRRTYTV